MAGEIIKVYNTYENALAGGSTGQILVGTINSNNGAVFNGSETLPYYIYREYWYRIELNDLATQVVIDWDDGEDNSLERQNVEFIDLEKPSKHVITSHIYTKHGSFFPLIRAVSPEGFISKWYTNDANSGYSDLEDLTYHTGSSTAPAGQNGLAIVREEKAGTDKIPHFIPANRHPIAILKADRKAVYAGIDNDLISGTSPLLYAVSDTNVSSPPTVTFEASNTESKQVREYANIQLQTLGTTGGYAVPNLIADGGRADNYINLSIQNDTVPKGAVYTPAIKEKGTFTVAADTVDNSIGANNGLSNPDGGAPYIALYNSSDTSAAFRVWWKHPDVAQVYSIELTGGDTMSAYAGCYIAIDYPSPPAGEAPVYFWLDHSGSASEPGALSLVFAKKKVDISGAANAAAAATILAAAINDGFTFTNAVAGSSSMNAFTAPNSGTAIFNVTCDTAGETASPGIAQSGDRVAVNITTHGESAGVIPSGSFTSIFATGSSGDSAATITTALIDAINTQGTFTAAAVDADTLTIERDTAGTTQDFTESGSTYTLDSLTQGTPAQGEIAPVHKLYKAKLDSITTLLDDHKVFIKCHDFDGSTGTATPNPDTDKTIAVLTNGNPIVELNDPYTITTLDASESYARASNLKIDTFSYDLDKQTVTGSLHNDQGSIAHGTTNVSNDTGTQTVLTDYFGYDEDGVFTALNYGEQSRISQRYTFNSLGSRMDDNSRFHDTYYLERFSPITNWNSMGVDSGETVHLVLGTAGSFTKDATVTQATSGATGKVFRTTKNNKWLELYDVAGTFNTSNTITSSNSIDVDAGITPSTVDTGNLRLLKEDYVINRSTLMVATGSGRTTHANNKTDSTANVNQGGTVSLTTDTLTVTDGTQFAIGDYIAIANDTEIMKVTAKPSTHVLTISRGVFATNSTTHSDSTDVYKILPKWHVVDSGSTNLYDSDSILLGGASTYELATSTAVTDHPENFIVSVMPQKYDKLYFKIDNYLPNGPTTFSEPDINIAAYYTKRTIASNVATYSWEPLPIIDKTEQFRQSGIIKWDIPDDWASVHTTDLTWNVVGDNNGTGDPESQWTKDGYGLILAITVKTPTTDTDAHEQIRLYNVWPMVDEHTELIKVMDPHHVSLNSIAIAQSISYSRKGRYMVVEDRLGKSDIRRIGAEGGTISFGGIDLGSDATGRDLILSYQKNGTPVFIDIEHNDGDKTRFFGKITSMSEDYATGKFKPKWAVTMQCSHLIEMNSSGVMQSEKISLGGVIDDVSKYIL